MPLPTEVLLPNGQVLAVIGYNYGPDGFVLSGTDYIHRFDYDANNNLIYFGSAVPTSLDSAAVWQIIKFTYDANNNMLTDNFAGGSASFTNIWNDRASLSYS